LKSNNIKIILFKEPSKSIYLFIFSIFFIFLKGDFLNAEYLSENYQIDTSTKIEDNGPAIPTNPFEIVEMIRRNNSLNDATSPSDALDDALESFKTFEAK
tara:strand:- start:236 stop:535 length:300 start_codon:yes stop_codon:yes gene_type:complete